MNVFLVFLMDNFYRTPMEKLIPKLENEGQAWNPKTASRLQILVAGHH